MVALPQVIWSLSKRSDDEQKEYDCPDDQDYSSNFLDDEPVLGWRSYGRIASPIPAAFGCSGGKVLIAAGSALTSSGRTGEPPASSSVSRGAAAGS
jgi:hypothetical protein